MKRTFFYRILGITLVLCVFTVFFSGGQGAVRAAEESAAEPEIRGWLIRMRDGMVPNGLLDEIGEDLYLTRSESVAEDMVKSPYVEYVEPNYVISLIDDETGTAARAATSSDWSYKTVDGPYANGLGLDGTGVRIAVIDSGVYRENANLAGANIADGRDYTDETAQTKVVSDGYGHGTKVCQMIAGSGYRETCVVGPAPGAVIVPLRCFDDYGASDNAWLYQAIRDAVEVFHCDIINMSWGVSEKYLTQTLRDEIEHAAASGAILVAAAGNTSSSAPQGTVMYPAMFSEVIGVGNVDKNLSVASTSQETAAVMVYAPGNALLFAENSGGTVTKSGTSYAAPLVAAELALLRQMVPGLSVTEATSLLNERAVPLPASNVSGAGLVRMTELLGDRWYSIRTDGTEKTFTLSGWHCGGTGSRVIAAYYDENGRLRDVEYSGICGGDNPDGMTLAQAGGFVFTHDASAAEARLFFVRDGFIPWVEKISETPGTLP